MNTITIPDPSDVLQHMRAKFPGLAPTAQFGSYSGESPTWTLSLWRGADNISARGNDIDELMISLAGKLDELGPAAKLAKQAAEIGMKLVPA